ncbi:MAG: hypothetical protein WEC33_09255 [Dehalococcoidia bacterium]
MYTLVQPLIERLVVAHAAKVQQVAQEEVAEIHQHRQHTASQWPAQHR